MSYTHSKPTLLPNYISDENWNAYIALLSGPDSFRKSTFREAEGNVRRVAAAALEAGRNVELIPMDVGGWSAWALKNKKAFTWKSQIEYTIRKFESMPAAKG